MQLATATHSHKPEIKNRTLFLVYSCYRLGIAAILLILFFTDIGFGQQNSTLYLLTTALYFSVNALLLKFFTARWQPENNTLLLIIASDIIFLQLAALASGLVSSGLGALLIVSVASGSIFISSKQSLLVPALATITLLLNVSLDVANGHSSQSALVASGWLGIAFFVTNIGVQYLARQLRSSEQLAEREAAQSKKLENLNSIIIERMQTGVAVLDQNANILSCNIAGRRLLNLDQATTSLENPAQTQQLLAPEIKHLFSDWQHRTLEIRSENAHAGTQNIKPVQAFPGGPSLKISFISLTTGEASENLMFIEDLGKITQQAQHLKLASLGQLTANIAHEIRNPLGAASHAAQLLEESSESEEDKKLTGIICQQTKRCSNIIDSVMSVSRGQPVKIQRFDLCKWLEAFIDNYQLHTPCDIKIQRPQSLMINFDPNQLTQIVSNLLDNGLRYSAKKSALKSAGINVGADNTGSAFLDILDFGDGVDNGSIPHLFEPFFTSETAGSGLGLYICRELCEANQARISYVTSNTNGIDWLPGACRFYFRINFAHPDRKSYPSITDSKWMPYSPKEKSE